MENISNMLLHQTMDGDVKIDVRLHEETVWPTQEQMAFLFGKAKSTINEHIKNIFKEGELDETLVRKKFGISEFQQKAPIFHYLDVIISVGYRVKSQKWPIAESCLTALTLLVAESAPNPKDTLIKPYSIRRAPVKSHDGIDEGGQYKTAVKAEFMQGEHKNLSALARACGIGPGNYQFRKNTKG